MPQSLSQIILHIVFSTKDRRPWIRPDIESELHRYLVSVCNACDCPVRYIGGGADHVHLVCTLSRTVAVSDLLEEIKKRSSKWVKTRDGAFRLFAWQRGYGVFSLGQSQLGSVARYVTQQSEHHKKRDFQEEFRALLRRYGVAYDERYVWD